MMFGLRSPLLVFVALLCTACGSAGDASDGNGSDTDDDATGDGDGDGDVGDCNSPGWSTVFVPWEQLAYQGLPPDGGFSICVPEQWEVISDSSNIVQLARDGETVTTIVLGGELRLDHAGAVQRVSEHDQGRCTEDDYGFEFLPVDGWPGLQQRYTFTPPACGECPDPDPEDRYAVSTVVATAELLVRVAGETSAPPAPSIVDELAAIGKTLEATGISSPVAGETAQHIAELEAAHDNACP